jgi:hypothetical protein
MSDKIRLWVKKSKEIDKQIKVVLMSAFEIQQKELNVLPDTKVCGFLQKPFFLRTAVK